MSDALMCDQCGATTRDTEEDRGSWLVIGWIDTGIDHACSLECATAILDAMRTALGDAQ